MAHFNTKHGMDGTPTYRTWVDMRRRCNKPHRKDYKNYGGRGISVCQRWNKFENFLEDMGVRPENHTLDRIDNNGNYEPNNCKWSSRKTQERNKRTNHFIHVDGEIITIMGASEKFKINPMTIYNRINTLKWDHEKAVKTPVKPKHHKLTKAVDSVAHL